MLEQAKKRQKIEVVNDQYGKPTSGSDLCKQVKWLIESNEYPSGIYHITNDGITNWYEFAKTIFKLAKIKMDVIPCSSAKVNRKAKRPAYSALNNNKLPALRPWQEAALDYINETKKSKFKKS
jgi:dTDP-4-dehydrorhamnose reductase